MHNISFSVGQSFVNYIQLPCDRSRLTPNWEKVRSWDYESANCEDQDYFGALIARIGCTVVLVARGEGGSGEPSPTDDGWAVTSQGRGMMTTGRIPNHSTMLNHCWDLEIKETMRTGHEHVEARMTPFPSSCALIALNSKSIYADRYRKKGDNSGAPEMATKAPKNAIRVDEIA